ncbi:MAG: PilW family protein, partial [Gammaproteobacteria bacterium]
FVSNKQAYRVQEGLARLQENGRFAIDFITRDVRGAGFAGCAGSTTTVVNTLNNASSYAWDFDLAVQGAEATSATAWTPALDASIVSAQGGRDVLTVRRALGDPVTVTKHPGGDPPGSADIQVVSTQGLSDFDIVMITDCSDAAVFQITNVNTGGGNNNIVHNTGVGSPGNATKALGKDYTGTGEIVRISTITYYIGSVIPSAGSTFCPPGRPECPVLFRQVGAAAAEELIEGVQDMQIRYGVDTDGDRVANQYLQANAVADFNNVVSVRLDLLLQTMEDNLTNAPQRYTYDNGTCGGGCTPADRRYRQVFSATIGLRNKVL